MKINPCSVSVFMMLMLTPFICLIYAQEREVLRYSPTQIESLFLEHNLLLIAEKMNIDIADAGIHQARQWDNPELSIESVNMWASKRQQNEADLRPFPKNAQFSIELSQLITTAGKRSKLVNMAQTSKDISTKEFENVLRSLMVELRVLIRETEYLQTYEKVLNTQKHAVENLIKAFEKQVRQKNIAQTELFRLQSGLIEIEGEINETKTQLNKKQTHLKSLLNISPLSSLKIESSDNETPQPDLVWLADLLEITMQSRPDIKIEQLQSDLYRAAFAYEKAQRIPDITLSASYDRYGGVWKDFVGIGISFNLPILNRNKGNIKAAEISLNQRKQLITYQRNVAQNEVAEAFVNYSQAYSFYHKIADNELFSDLDKLLDLYTKNLLNKNISMLEYIHFMESYRNNKQTLISAKKEMYISFSELQFATGTELK